MLLALLLLLALIAPQQSSMTSCIHIILPVSAPTTCRRNSIGGDLGGEGHEGTLPPPKREVDGTELLISPKYFVNINVLIV